tara:strand:- start:286 stop:1368 length:1083 start_codon:yes stop_codon:yes gene_type:complete
MAKVEQKEFEVGDTIEKSDIQGNFTNVRDTKISNINIREEGISEEMIAENTVFQDPYVVEGITKAHTEFESDKPFPGGSVTHVSDSLEPLWRTPGGYTHFWNTKEIQFLPKPAGHDTIVRCSCTIFMRDYGSRTFFTGLPPTIGVQLYYISALPSTYATGELLKDKDTTSIVTGSTGVDFSRSWLHCEGTRQKFRRAFSSKIPSASGLNEEIYNYGTFKDAVAGDSSLGHITIRQNNIFNNGGYNPSQDTREKTGLSYDSATNADIESSLDVRTNSHMFFNYNFNYNVVWRFEHSGTAFDLDPDQPIRVIALFTSHIPVQFEEGHPSVATSTKPLLGCGQVEFDGFTIRNFTLDSYTISN